MHFGGAIFFADYSVPAMELAIGAAVEAISARQAGLDGELK